MTKIEIEITTQGKVADWINKNLTEEYSFENEKAKLAFTCFDLVMEHHAGIITLCNTKIYGSAFALLRVQYEAFIRGLWLKHVATDTEIKKFKKGQNIPKFGVLIEGVERELKIESGLLSYIKDKQWALFNSFTHTGIEAVMRRIGSRSTGYDNYDAEEVVIALMFSGSIAIMCASELAILKNNKETIDNVLEYWQKYKEKKI
jgi:hypothetical protein